jgi:hypothetical protein
MSSQSRAFTPPLLFLFRPPVIAPSSACAGDINRFEAVEYIQCEVFPAAINKRIVELESASLMLSHCLPVQLIRS